MPYHTKGVDLDLILNNISDGISVHDLDWRFIYANERIAEIVGLPLHQLSGKNLWEVYSDSRDTNLATICEHVRSTGLRESATVHNPITKHWYQLDIYPSAESFTIIARDITEQQSLKIKAESALEQLRLITNSVPALISYVDQDLRYRFVNRGYEIWFKKSNSEIVGKHLAEIVGQQAFEAAKPHLENALAGNHISFEREQHYSDDLVKYVRVHLVPDFDAEANVKGCVVLVEDLTDRKSLERSQAASEERLRVALKNIPLILTHNDLELKYTWMANPLPEYTTQEIIGKRAEDFLPADLAEKLDAIKVRAMETMRPVTEEISSDVQNEHRYFAIHVEPRFDTSGNLLGTTTAALDTSNWRKNESRLVFLARISEKLSTSLTNPDLLQSVTDLVIGTFADCCSITEPDGESFRLLAFSVGDKAHEASIREFIHKYALKHRRVVSAVISSSHPFYVPHVTDDLLTATFEVDEERELVRSTDFRSVISVPLETRGEVIGAITFALRNGKHYKPDDVEFARMLGRRIAAAIDNSRLYQSALREIEERKRAEIEKEHLAYALDAERQRLSNIISSVPGVVYETRGEPGTPDYRIVYVSDTIYDWTGMLPAAMIHDSKLWMQNVPEDELPKIYEQVQAMDPNEDYGVISYKMRLKDGSVIDAESHFRTLFDRTGKRIGRCGVLMDVTERAKTEREREELRNELDRERTRLREIMASIPGAVYETSGTPGTSDYRLEYISPYVEQMLGRTPEEIGSDPLFWLHHCPKDYRDEVLERIRNLPQDIDTGSFTFKWMHVNGPLFDVEAHYRIRRDAEGKVIGRVGVVMDVSERLAAQQELNERRRQLATLVANLPGVAYRCLTTKGWPFEYASEGCYELTGYRAEDFLVTGPVRWFDIINPDDIPEIDRIVEDAIARDIPIEVTYRIRTATGEEKYVLDRAIFIRDERNEIVAFEGIMIDITAIKKAQEAIVEANQAKDQFIAALSHELRTPLTPVLTCVEALKEDERIPGDLLPLIQIIERNIELEARLIDDLLDLTRIIRGKIHLEKKSVDLHSLLFNALDICTSKIKEKAIDLSLELSAKQTIINGDPARIQQVMWNIMQNAAKFTPVNGRIAIKSWNSAQNEIYISIQDSGIGLHPDHLSRIFNAFEQGSSMITRKFGGLGLGLAISQRIIDLHSGTIEAFSDGEGTGATFTIKLDVTPKEVIGLSQFQHREH